MKSALSRLSPSAARTRRGPARAFTIVEVIVIVVILGVLAGIVAPRLLNRIGQSKTAAAEAGAANLATAMKLFMADVGTVPPGSTIQILWERPPEVDAASWRGPYVDNAEALLDPWNRPFLLRIPGQKNADFDIVSFGADGTPGGTDENADIIKP